MVRFLSRPHRWMRPLKPRSPYAAAWRLGKLGGWILISARALLFQAQDKNHSTIMSHTEEEQDNRAVRTGRDLGMAVAIAAITLFSACNYGGDNETSHAPVNPAMAGSPQESDHTNTDAEDLQGGYGTGTDEAAVKDDNIDRTQGSPIPVPAAKDSTAH